MNTPVRYLIVNRNKNSEPFFTNYFDVENFYAEGDIVCDLHACKYTEDGKTWHDIKDDHL